MLRAGPPTPGIENPLLILPSLDAGIVVGKSLSASPPPVVPSARPALPPLDLGTFPDGFRLDAPLDKSIRIGLLNDPEATHTANSLSAQWLGRALSGPQYARLVAAPAGSRVSIEAFERSSRTLRGAGSDAPERGINIQVRHPAFLGHENGYRASFDADLLWRDGAPELHINWIRLPKDAPRNTGAFQAESIRQAAHHLGIPRIALDAVGGGEMNGHVAWPRFGWDALIPKLATADTPKDLLPFRLKSPLPQALSHCRTVQDLMLTPGGYTWWKENGCNLEHAVLLTDPNAVSAQVLRTYVQTSPIDAPTVDAYFRRMAGLKPAGEQP